MLNSQETRKEQTDGMRQRRAAELRAELEAQERPAPAATEAEASPAPEEQASPVGEGDHIVKLGECMSSIARATGHFWERLWGDPANSQLRQVREDPHMLLPGDRVTVPPIASKYEPGESEMRHRFRRRGEPGILRLVVKDMDEPRANQPYVLKFEDREVSGFTDAFGQLEEPIRPDARRATLIVGEGIEQVEYELNLGHLHPIESTTGVQARLENLGYAVGAVDGVVNEPTIAAIERFCGEHHLEPPPKGQIGTVVREKLKEVHGF